MTTRKLYNLLYFMVYLYNETSTFYFVGTESFWKSNLATVSKGKTKEKIIHSHSLMYSK